ncbi:MAG: aminotransferase class V-fold PLP-dependent enzyme [Gemmatimonadaceae bacterium]
MAISRREVLAGLGTLAAASAVRPLHALGMSPPRSSDHAPDTPIAGDGFPRKADFNLAEGYTYLSGAYTHPMPRASVEAMHGWVNRRSTVGGPPAPPRTDPRLSFAALINAKPSEVGFIPNTSTGENFVVEALGIRRFDGNVVTDALHFEGALVHLKELQKEGLDLRIVAPQKDGRIDLEDMARVVDRKTRLIEVSLVSMYNGFQHDLKAVCDLAHAHGAYVYADIIQGVGAVPFDVKATGVDFAATASYKWLMGDFGVGFMYIREELLGRMVRRTHWSYESAPDTELHLSPFDPEYPKPVTWTPGTQVPQYVQLGTYAIGASVALAVSIPYIQALGVDQIEQHRQPMLQKLQQEMPRLGFTPQTPAGSKSPIVTFAHKDTTQVGERLDRAKVTIRVAPTWVRIAPSVYNDMADIDRLLNALS